MPRATDLLSVGELARRAGVATSALRYYESLGLLPADRTTGGQRRYPRSALRRVAVIQAGQRAGLSLAAIRAGFAGLPADKAPTRREWQRISAAWRAELDARIAELRRVRDDLSACIGCGCLSLRRCTLYNPGDRAAGNGPGPRWLLSDDPDAPDQAAD